MTPATDEDIQIWKVVASDKRIHALIARIEQERQRADAVTQRHGIDAQVWNQMHADLSQQKREAQNRAQSAEARAERMAEALRDVRGQFGDCGKDDCTSAACLMRRKIEAALADPE